MEIIIYTYYARDNSLNKSGFECIQINFYLNYNTWVIRVHKV